MADKKCDRCSGKGTITCPTCKGRGKIRKGIYIPIFDDMFDKDDDFSKCVNCDGAGKVRCSACHGNGVLGK